MFEVKLLFNGLQHVYRFCGRGTVEKRIDSIKSKSKDTGW